MVSWTGWGEPGSRCGGKPRREEARVLGEQAERERAVMWPNKDRRRKMLMMLHVCVGVCASGKWRNMSCERSRGCSALTGRIWAEVNCQDVVAEARDVFQLSQVSLQRAAGQSRFVKRSHEAKHKGVQTGGPTQTYANTNGSATTHLKLGSHVIPTSRHGLLPGSFEVSYGALKGH